MVDRQLVNTVKRVGEGWGGGELAFNANETERETEKSARAEEKATMSREKARFPKRFLQKGPSHSP